MSGADIASAEAEPLGAIVADAPLELYRKLADIFAAIEALEKLGEGQDSSDQAFKFTRSEDVIETVRGKMIEHRLLLKPDTVEGGRLTPKPSGKYLTTASLAYTWICCDTGQTLRCEWKGTGEDDADKGLYTAYTGSKKYFLLDFFLIPTFADSERNIRPNPQGAVTTNGSVRNGVGQPSPTQLTEVVRLLKVAEVPEAERQQMVDWAKANLQGGEHGSCSALIAELTDPARLIPAIERLGRNANVAVPA